MIEFVDVSILRDLINCLEWENVDIVPKSPRAFCLVCISLADLDFDGDIDRVIGKYGEPNRIYLNDGWGNLTDPNHIFGGNDLTQWVALADLDNDGDWDIIFAEDYTFIRIYYCN